MPWLQWACYANDTAVLIAIVGAHVSPIATDCVLTKTWYTDREQRFSLFGQIQLVWLQQYTVTQNYIIMIITVTYGWHFVVLSIFLPSVNVPKCHHIAVFKLRAWMHRSKINHGHGQSLPIRKFDFKNPNIENLKIINIIKSGFQRGNKLGVSNYKQTCFIFNYTTKVFFVDTLWKTKTLQNGRKFSAEKDHKNF